MTETAPDFDKLAGYIGLAVRAGQAVTGEGACVAAIRAGKAAVAMLDGAASENAAKRLTDACTHHRVPLIKLPSELMQKAAGKPGRMAMVMTPGGLASKVMECMGKNMENI
jgi:ribosomal protein L7Ae-like RNA K-turn-binding protein